MSLIVPDLSLVLNSVIYNEDQAEKLEDHSSDSWLHIDSEVKYEDIENSIPEDSKIDALANSKIIPSMQKSKTQIEEINQSRLEASDDLESKEDYL